MQYCLKGLKATGEKFCVMNFSGFVNGFVPDVKKSDGTLQALYGRETFRYVVVDNLVREFSPSEEFSINFFNSAALSADNEDFAKNYRIYRYMTAELLLQFGYNLSYTCLAIRKSLLRKLLLATKETLKIIISISNSRIIKETVIVQKYG
jgi:hypothetical protein